MREFVLVSIGFVSTIAFVAVLAVTTYHDITRALRAKGEARDEQPV